MFERLTRWENNDKDVADLIEEKSDFDGLTEAINRLAEYEDSGLSPEEVQELAQAKAEGRLVVLPCKVGDTVYEPRKDRGIISEYEITEIIINKYGVSFFRWNLKEGIYSHLGGFPVECLGKTVFLTREEAEKALEVREPIEPEEIFNNRWHCEHSAYVEDAKPTCKTTGMPCCRCQPGSCEHRG